MLRVFLVSVHETGMLRYVLETLARLDAVFRGCCGVRVGLLVNWRKWRYRVEWVVGAKRRYGLVVLVDSGAFSEPVDPVDVVRYARWACSVHRFVDGFLMPDRLALRERGARGRLEAIDETVKAHALWALVASGCGAHRGGVAVLQGLYPDEYLETLAQLLEYVEEYSVLAETQSMSGNGGVFAGVYALGSLKARGWRAPSPLRGTLRRLLGELEDLLPPGTRLHLLGVHGRDLHQVWHLDSVYSADTGAQGLNYTKKHRDVLGCNGLDPRCYAKAVEHEVLSSLEPLLRLSRVHTLDEFLPTAVVREVVESGETQGT